MPLPDPELDMLREMLKEEPAAPAFVQVGQELLWRSRFEDAVDVLRAGIDASDDVPEDAWEVLAEAALKGGQVLKALGALEHLESDAEANETHARLRVQVLEAAGKLADAKAEAEAFLDVHPQDVVVEAVVQRLAAPPPDVRRRLPDLLVNVGRAEAYAALGRSDRAIRVFRRLWFHYPQDIGLKLRIAELSARPAEAPEDLSEEIDEDTDTGVIPPGLTMPSPRSRFAGEPTPDLDEIDTDPDSEMTDPAIGFSVEDIRRQIEERKRAAMEKAKATPTPTPAPLTADDVPFVYGEGTAPGDDEPTVALPHNVTDALPEDIERHVREVREKARKRRTLIKGQPP